MELAQSTAVDPDRASAWTIPLLCAGIAVIACCLLIPAADENRRLAYERDKLKLDLEQIQKQIGINDARVDYLGRIRVLSCLVLSFVLDSSERSRACGVVRQVRYLVAVAVAVVVIM